MNEALKLTSGMHFDLADLGDDYYTIGRHPDSSPYIIEVMYLGVRNSCPICSKGEFISHGRSTITVWDVPCGGPRKLVIHKQDYVCNNPGCDKSRFSAQPTKIDDRFRITDRLREYIIDHVVRRFPLDWISDDTGLSSASISNIFMESFRKLEQEHVTVLPEFVGIDETRIGGVVRAPVTDLKNRRMLEVLKSDKATVITKYLEMIPSCERDKVKAIVYDHRESFRSIGVSMLANSDGVTDHFHFSAIIENCFDKVRIDEENKIMMLAADEFESQVAVKSFSPGEKGEKEKEKIKEKITNRALKKKSRLCKNILILRKRFDNLNEGHQEIVRRLLADYPQIGVAHQLKEELLKIWNSEISEEEARAHYLKWTEMPEEMKVYFQPVMRLMDSWEKEIFAFFKHRVTNGYTESMNNQMERYYSNAMSCSFDLLRAVFLYQTFLEDNMARRRAERGVPQVPQEHSEEQDAEARTASMRKGMERFRELGRRRASAKRAREPENRKNSGPLLF